MPYDDTLQTDRDRARSILGDTDDDHPLHSDDHIEAVLTAQGSLALGVSYLAHELVVRYEQDPVKFENAGGSYDFKERLTSWRLLATPYRAALAATMTAATGTTAAQTLSGGVIRLGFQESIP